ncbi:MAG: hypothetical protein ABIL11_12485 [Chloroflexota bacterium]
MSEWLRHIFRRITGISTPFGGISWHSSATAVSKVPTLRETIYITWPENHEIISFLGTNDRRIIFLDTHIDASVAFKEQFEIVEKERIDLDLITSCAFSGVPLPLPNREGNLVTVTFSFNDDHVLKYSAGGTGIITVGINGFFEVSRTFHGGPTTAFHLKEVKASLEAKVDILNR